MKRLSRGDAVKFEFSSSEEIEDILKLHKVNFEKLAGSNNRNSNWFNHPKRKPLYQILPALAFAMWNEEFRFDNGYGVIFEEHYIGEDISEISAVLLGVLETWNTMSYLFDDADKT